MIENMDNSARAGAWSVTELGNVLFIKSYNMRVYDVKMKNMVILLCCLAQYCITNNIPDRPQTTNNTGQISSSCEYYIPRFIKQEYLREMK